jgi:hypothetical protein
MSVLLSTTGIVSTVTINDLGGVLFTHPVSSYDLTIEWTYEELQDSIDLGTALDAGYISLINSGVTIANSSELELIQPQPDTVGESEKFSVNLDNSLPSVVRTFAGGVTSYAVTHGFSTLNPNISVYEISTNEEVLVDKIVTSASIVTIRFSGNSTDNTFRVVISI